MKMTESQTWRAKFHYDYIHFIWKNGVDWNKERGPREVPVFEDNIDAATLKRFYSAVSALCSYAETWCKGRHYRSSLRGCVETDVRVLRELKPSNYKREDIKKYIQDVHSWSINLAQDLKLN